MKRLNRFKVEVIFYDDIKYNIFSPVFSILNHFQSTSLSENSNPDWKSKWSHLTLHYQFNRVLILLSTPAKVKTNQGTFTLVKSQTQNPFSQQGQKPLVSSEFKFFKNFFYHKIHNTFVGWTINKAYRRDKNFRSSLFTPIVSCRKYTISSIENVISEQTSRTLNYTKDYHRLISLEASKAFCTSQTD